MARRRQHAAHEVGHTLGLAHSFIAASYGRASVMDYPAPSGSCWAPWSPPSSPCQKKC